MWAIYIPGTQKEWEDQKTDYDKIQDVITSILKIDSERLDLASIKSTEKQFSYSSAIKYVADSCLIKESQYKVNSGAKASSGGETTQSASVKLNGIDITQFSKFISTIQLRWANLQCKSITLQHKKGQKDKWDIRLDFQYFF